MEKRKNTVINTYLMFNGNAREAMTFYKDVFGGDLQITAYSQAPMDVPEETKNKVMHSILHNGSLQLMASDSMFGEVTHGKTTQLCASCSSLEEIEKYFAGISVGGTVTMPLSDQAGENRFGMLTDKYGFDWMFNYSPKA